MDDRSGLRRKEDPARIHGPTLHGILTSQGRRGVPRRCHVTVIRALLLFSSLPPPTHLAVPEETPMCAGRALFRDKQGGPRHNRTALRRKTVRKGNRGFVPLKARNTRPLLNIINPSTGEPRRLIGGSRHWQLVRGFLWGTFRCL